MNANTPDKVQILDRIERTRRDLSLAKLDIKDGLVEQAIVAVMKAIRDLTALHNEMKGEA